MNEINILTIVITTFVTSVVSIMVSVCMHKLIDRMYFYDIKFKDGNIVSGTIITHISNYMNRILCIRAYYNRELSTQMDHTIQKNSDAGCNFTFKSLIDKNSVGKTKKIKVKFILERPDRKPKTIYRKYKLAGS